MFSLISLIGLIALPTAIASPQYDEDYQPGLNPCVNWEDGAAAYQEAFAKWQEPLCYNFTYAFEGYGDGTPVVRSVQNGTSLQGGDDGLYNYYSFSTLADVWNTIDEACFRNCPDSGAHSCEIRYRSSNNNGLVYPSSFEIDPEDKVDGDGFAYVFSDVKTFDCPSSSQPGASVLLGAVSLVTFLLLH